VAPRDTFQAPLSELLVKVQSGTRVVESLPLEHLQQFPGKYRIKYNRRGNAVRAFLRDRELPWASISKRGTHFLQRLPNAGGTCWALHGVRGS